MVTLQLSATYTKVREAVKIKIVTLEMNSKVDIVSS